MKPYFKPPLGTTIGDLVDTLRGISEFLPQPTTYRGWTIRHEPSGEEDGLDWTMVKDGLVLRSFSEADCRDEIDGMEDGPEVPAHYSLTPTQQAREEIMERVGEDESWIEDEDNG